MKALIYILCSLAVGLVIGYGASMSLTRNVVSSQLSNLQTKYPTADFQVCQSAGAAINSCTSEVLLNLAVTNKSASICDDITLDQFKADCQARVQTINSMNGSQTAFCGGFASDQVCVDLSLALKAAETKDSSACGQIKMDTIRYACLSLSGGAAVAPTFGLNCDSTTTQCVQSRKDFKAAVLADDITKCPTLFKDQCVFEVTLYKVFHTDDLKNCGSIQADVCKDNLLLAQALDKKDSLICKNSMSPDSIKRCQDVVSASAGVKRFDYLSTY